MKNKSKIANLGYWLAKTTILFFLLLIIYILHLFLTIQTKK
jgi:hypothetical protein